MPVHYRRWTADDMKSVRDVLWKTWLDSYSPFIPESDLRWFLERQYSDAEMNKLFNDPNVNGILAETDGHVVGFIRTKFSREEARHYVSSLYILPEQQSKGIGRQLMLRAAEEATAHHLDCVWLGVMVENRSAVDWYKNMGFRVEKEEPFVMGTTTVNHYIGFMPVATIRNPKKKPS